MEIYCEFLNPSNYECSVIDHADLFLHMNEKEVSVLAFPTSGDRFDYLGFEATDETINWCKDVFERYWRLSKPFPIP